MARTRARSPGPTDKAVALAVYTAAGLDVRATVARLHGEYRWDLDRIAAAWGVTWRAMLRRIHPYPDDRRPPSKRVRCPRCRWTRCRPILTATLRPCPKCGAHVQLGTERRSRTTARERLGDTRVALHQLPLTLETWTALRKAAGRNYGWLVRAILARWAAGLEVPAGWTGPESRKRELNQLGNEPHAILGDAD